MFAIQQLRGVDWHQQPGSVHVQAGADVNVRDSEGSRPIDAAALAGQKAIVKLLLPHMPAKADGPSSVDQVMASAADSRPAPHSPIPTQAAPSSDITVRLLACCIAFLHHFHPAFWSWPSYQPSMRLEQWSMPCLNGTSADTSSKEGQKPF